MFSGVTAGGTGALTTIDSGDYSLQVTGGSDSDTADPLLTKTEVMLQASSVYTLFMSSSGGTVSGTLRKDR